MAPPLLPEHPLKRHSEMYNSFADDVYCVVLGYSIFAFDGEPLNPTSESVQPLCKTKRLRTCIVGK